METPRSAVLASPGFECVLGTRALVRSHVAARSVTYVTRPSFRHQVRGACGDALFLSFSFFSLESKGHDFEWPRFGPNLPLRFLSFGRHFDCLHLYLF